MSGLLTNVKSTALIAIRQFYSNFLFYLRIFIKLKLCKHYCCRLLTATFKMGDKLRCAWRFWLGWTGKLCFSIIKWFLIYYCWHHWPFVCIVSLRWQTFANKLQIEQKRIINVLWVVFTKICEFTWQNKNQQSAKKKLFSYSIVELFTYICKLK